MALGRWQPGEPLAGGQMCTRCCRAARAGCWSSAGISWAPAGPGPPWAPGTQEQADPLPASLGLCRWVVKVEERHGPVRGGRGGVWGRHTGLALLQPCPALAADPGTGCKEVTVSVEWLGRSPQGASASPSAPPLPLLHLWGLSVFNFLFSVNEKPLGKQPVRPHQLLPQAQQIGRAHV